MKYTTRLLKKLDLFLVRCALERARDDEHVLFLFSHMNPRNLSPADRDTLNEYTFGSVRGIVIYNPRDLG